MIQMLTLPPLELLLPPLASLIAAHMIADFALQTTWMVKNKTRWQGLASHGAIVGLVHALALGGKNWDMWAVIVLTHLLIDAIKARNLPDRFWAFALDQMAHLAVLVGVAIYIANGPGAAWGPEFTGPFVFISGLILASLTGGPCLNYLMSSLPEQAPFEGIKGAGRIIGILERTLIFGLIIAGEAGAVGFLIAAKSVLRFDAVKKSEAVSEYVIIGTLASFAWAFAAGYGTQLVLASLPAAP